jgi:uncharacterized protein YodC (DUF2158 family)
MTQFKKGDVVYLKSGGPQITVNSGPLAGGGGNSVECIWFVGTKRFEGVFDQDALTDHDPKPLLPPMSSRS